MSTKADRMREYWKDLMTWLDSLPESQSDELKKGGEQAIRAAYNLANKAD